MTNATCIEWKWHNISDFHQIVVVLFVNSSRTVVFLILSVKTLLSKYRSFFFFEKDIFALLVLPEMWSSCLLSKATSMHHKYTGVFKKIWSVKIVWLNTKALNREQKLFNSLVSTTHATGLLRHNIANPSAPQNNVRITKTHDKSYWKTFWRFFLA